MRIFFLVLVAVAATLAFWHWRPWAHRPAVTPPVSSTPAAPVSRFNSFQRQKAMQGPRPPITSTKESLAVSAECFNVWQDIQKLDFQRTVFFEGDRRDFPETSHCVGLPGGLEAWQKSMAEKCKPQDGSLDAKARLAQRDECITATFYYRAFINDYLTREDPLGSITDPAILTDKLFARFMQSPESAASVAERLLELDPKNYTAAKALMISELLGAAAKAGGQPGDPRWEKVRADIARAKELFPHDAELRQADLLFTSQQTHDPEQVFKQAQEVADSYPTSGVGPYYQAYASFKKGDMAKTQEYLAECLKREPGNNYCVGTQAAIQKKEGSPFQATLHFSYDPNTKKY